MAAPEASLETLFAASRDVEGWLSDGAIGLFALLANIQSDNGIGGDIFEIGCHHGKSAIVLALLAERATERVTVCDLFARQEQNLSRSGRGDREIFRANLQSVFGDCDFVRILEQRSQDLTVEEVGRGHRLIHIDGGHGVDEVRSDLELAANCLGDRGAIVCDDALHPGWPTVAEAVFGFLFEHRGAFSPVAVGFNKMVIVPAAAAALYAGYLERADYCWQFIPRNATRGLRRLQLCGQETLCFIPRYWEGVTQDPA